MAEYIFFITGLVQCCVGQVFLFMNDDKRAALFLLSAICSIIIAIYLKGK